MIGCDEMNYEESMEYINNTTKFGMNLGLQRINKLLEYMGNPQKGLKYIHIAGTNGKGSVTAMISKILMESGYKVGIYTSPYLQRFSERIKINSQEISKEDIARLVTYIAPLVEKVIEDGYEHPTEFEIITAVMFQYFNEKKVDFAVLEVGLGGRLDSTNVIDPLVSVITSISYDHMGVLGDTIEKIAYEKAGIIKENGVVVTYPQVKEASDVIKKVCQEKNAQLIEVNDHVTLKNYSIDGQFFDTIVNNENFEDIFISLLGDYQLLNAKTAIMAIKALSIRGIDIDKQKIYEGLKKVKWPGRLEVMRKSPVILLDGAHNIQGIQSLKGALLKYFKYDKLVLVMGVLKDKQVHEMCSELMPMADVIITTRPESDRAMSAQELGKIASAYCKNVYVSETMEEAFEKGIKHVTGKNDLLLFCGSLYMIGHIRSMIEQM